MEPRQVAFEIRASCTSPPGTSLTRDAERGRVLVSLERITSFEADPARSSVTGKKLRIVGTVVFTENNTWEPVTPTSVVRHAWSLIEWAAHLAWGTEVPRDHERSELVRPDIRVRELALNPAALEGYPEGNKNA